MFKSATTIKLQNYNFRIIYVIVWSLELCWIRQKNKERVKHVLRLFLHVPPLRYENGTQYKLYVLVKLLRLFWGIPPLNCQKREE